MARRSLSTKLATYQNEVDRSRRWRDNQGYDRLWNRLIDMYRGDHFDMEKLGDDEDLVAVNFAFSTINVILPAITVNDPQINVESNNPRNEDQARFVQGLINYLWRHHGFRKPFQLAAKDYLILGHGWSKVGWRQVEEQRELSAEEIDQMMAQQEQEIESALQADPTLGPSMPTTEELFEQLVNTQTVVVEDSPFVERISPFDMFVNVEATSMDNARWIAQKILVPLDEAKRNPAWNAKARRELQGNTHQYTNEGLDPREETDDEGHEQDLVLIWEFYDISNGEMCVFADGGKDFLAKPQDMPYTYGHPYEMLRNYDVPDMFYPIGDLEQIASLVQEISQTRSEMVNWRKKYARKYVYQAGTFSNDDIEKLMSSEDGLAIEIASHVPLDQAIIPLPTSPLDGQLFMYDDKITADINEVSGVSEYARGSGAAIRRTATEAAMIQDSLNARSAQKLAQVEDFVARIARKVLQISQQFVDGIQVARILGDDAQTRWEQYTRTDIQGEYDFSTEAGSTQPNNEAIRRQNAMVLAQTLSPFVEMGIVEPVALVREILTNGLGVTNWEKFITPTAQQQVAMLQAGMQPQQGMPAQPGAPGVDAPQQNPTEARDAEIAAQAEPSVGGIPDPLLNQLQSQNGLQPQGL